MPRKLFELKAILRRAGFQQRRTRGSHSVWEHPNIPGSSIILSGKDGDDAKPYQENMVNKITRSREAHDE